MTYSTPIFLSADFYKLSHRAQYPDKTEIVYSTWTPRSNKFAPYTDEVVFFGLQFFMQHYLIDRWNDDFFSKPKQEVIDLYSNFVKATLGDPQPYTKHLEDLHDLGYLPLKIKALKEGTKVPIKVPMFTIENTIPEFFWLTNFVETIASTTLWQSMVSATLANAYRRVLDRYAELTGVVPERPVDFQGHDFAMRGMSSELSAELSGAGHLLSFNGSDTIPAGFFLNKYYDAPLDATTLSSIPATEHSVMCAYGQTNEFELFKRLLTEVYPNRLFSVVSDTWDFWKVVGDYLPRLKSTIMNRDGRLVIRPDSGDPVEILTGRGKQRHFESLSDLNLYLQLMNDNLKNGHAVSIPSYEVIDDRVFYILKIDGLYVAHSQNEVDTMTLTDDEKAQVESIKESILKDKGLIECLWDIFGGYVNDKGYKVLDPHIGAIYGDSITLERATQICARLEEKGFASANVVYGIGSFSYQYNTRDTFGFAMKATYVQVDGVERLIFKDPKTDDGTKKSLKGRIAIVNDNGVLKAVDGLFKKDEEEFEYNELQVVFENGEILNRVTLSDVKQVLKG